MTNFLTAFERRPATVASHVAAPSAPDADVVRLREVVGAIRRRWYLLVAGTAVGGAAAIAYAKYTPRVYEATATLRLDVRQTPLPMIVARIPDPDAVFSEIELFHARPLAAQVVDSLGLRISVADASRELPRSALIDSARVAASADTGTYRLVWDTPDAVRVMAERSPAVLATLRPGVPGTVGDMRLTLSEAHAPSGPVTLRVHPRDAIIDALRSAVHVDRVGTLTNLISVRYEDRDPALAQSVVAAWVHGYLSQRQHVQNADATSTANVLRAQLDTLNAELRTSEDAFERYRERERMVNPETEATTQVTRLAQLQADRSAVDAERRALAGLMADVRTAAERARPEDPSPYRRILGFPTLLKNQAASQLLSSLNEVENQRATLLTRRTTLDPDVRVLTRRANEIEDQVRGVAESYLTGLGAQVAADDGQLAHFGAEIGRVPEREVEYARLQRQPVVLSQIVSTLSGRLKDAQVAASLEDLNLQVVNPAYVSATPIRPKPASALMAGLLAGALVGAAGIALKEQGGEPTVRTRSDVAGASQTPVLGAVPNLQLALPSRAARRLPRAAFRRVTAHSGAAAQSVGQRLMPETSTVVTEPVVAEDAYTRLCLSMMGGRPWTESGPRSLIVTSPLPGDGKTTSAVNLALTLARRGVRTILIDADLRRGGVDTRFGVPRSPGLTDVLRGAASLDATLRRVHVGNGHELTFITAGALQHNAPLLLASDEMADVHAALRGAFQAIIYDTPPVAVVSDAAVLAPLADGVILVVRAGSTARKAVEFAVEELRSVHAPLIGTLLNDVDVRDDGYRSSYYAYGAYGAYGASSGADAGV